MVSPPYWILDNILNSSLLEPRTRIPQSSTGPVQPNEEVVLGLQGPGYACGPYEFRSLWLGRQYSGALKLIGSRVPGPLSPDACTWHTRLCSRPCSVSWPSNEIMKSTWKRWRHYRNSGYYPFAFLSESFQPPVLWGKQIKYKAKTKLQLVFSSKFKRCFTLIKIWSSYTITSFDRFRQSCKGRNRVTAFAQGLNVSKWCIPGYRTER